MYELIVRIIADGLVIPIILVGAYALIVRIKPSHRYAAYCRILMAGLTSFLLAKLIASVYQPASERPFETLQIAAGALYLNNPGFPSDHALFTAAITGAVWFETRARGIAIALTVMTALVCVGRVLAHVHTPLDVIGGAVIAVIGMAWYLTDRTAKKSR